MLPIIFHYIKEIIAWKMIREKPQKPVQFQPKRCIEVRRYGILSIAISSDGD